MSFTSLVAQSVLERHGVKLVDLDTSCSVINKKYTLTSARVLYQGIMRP